MSLVEIKVGFWQTTVGIFIKRLFFSAVAIASLTLYTDIQNGVVDWDKVWFAVAGQVLYVIMTATRDFLDPKLPNTTTEAVKLEKA